MPPSDSPLTIRPMSTLPESSAQPNDALVESDPIGEMRMSFGDHLEELRSCVIRALVGVAGGTALAFYFGDHVLKVLLWPLLVVQSAHGFNPQLQALSPPSTFMVYMKVAFLAGLLAAMPWVLHQLWRFVSVGLYPRERKFVQALVWPSVALFAVGVLFLYFIVLPLMLQFFIVFNRAFPVPDLTPVGVQRWLLPEKTTTKTPEGSKELHERLRVVDSIPTDGDVGDIWFHSRTGRFVIKTPGGLRSIATEPGAGGSIIQSQFALDPYISFVLTLALAFGVAFETPVVVFFLTWTGMVPTETMSRGRRYVALIAVTVAAVLTPTPDLVGQLLLAVPIYLLFELGVLLSRIRDARVTRAAA